MFAVEIAELGIDALARPRRQEAQHQIGIFGDAQAFVVARLKSAPQDGFEVAKCAASAQ